MATTASGVGGCVDFHQHISDHHHQYYHHPDGPSNYHQHNGGSHPSNHHHAFQSSSLSSYDGHHQQVSNSNYNGGFDTASLSGINTVQNDNSSRNTVTPSPPENLQHHSSAFDIKNLALLSTSSRSNLDSNVKLNNKTSQSNGFYLPPIADALSRCKTGSEKTGHGRMTINSSESSSEKRNEAEDKFASLCKLAAVGLHCSNEVSSKDAEKTSSTPLSTNDNSSSSANDFAASTASLSTSSKSHASTITSAHAVIKNEGDATNQQASNLMYDLRNFAQQFGALQQRGIENEQLSGNIDMNAASMLSGHDVNNQAQVDLFFRNNDQQQGMVCDGLTSDGIQMNEVPSYATLTPLQSLPSITSSVSGNTAANYASLIGSEMLGDQNSYSKHHGMGHTLPPLSNRMLLNAGFHHQRAQQQTSAVMDAAAAAVATVFSPYTKSAAAAQQTHNQAHTYDVTQPFGSDMFNQHHMFPHQRFHVSPHQYQHAASAFNPTDLTASLHGNAANSTRRTRVPQQQLTHNANQIQMVQKQINSAGSVVEMNKNSVKQALNSSQQPNNGQMNCNENSQNASIEEVNTKAVAAKVTAELKRYSIPQAVFAHKILHRSQGTLSDLLRNPKPWSKLKSGRETFRRMFKWLQIPEETRMPDLRLAGQ